MVSFDRPNYGDIYNKNYIHSIPFEAEIALDLLGLFTSYNENIIVGYSYGGPIAMLAQFSEDVDRTVLIVLAVDPENEVIPFLLWFHRNN